MVPVSSAVKYCRGYFFLSGHAGYFFADSRNCRSAGTGNIARTGCGKRMPGFIVNQLHPYIAV